MLPLTLVSAVTEALAADGGGGGSCYRPDLLGISQLPYPPRWPPNDLWAPEPVRRAPHVSPQSGGRGLRTAWTTSPTMLPGRRRRRRRRRSGCGDTFRCLRPRRLPSGSARWSAMELAELGGESLRRGRSHSTAPGPQLPPACPMLGSPVPSHGSGIGKMGGVMEELGVGRAKLRIPGSGVQHGTGFGEASRGGVESGWSLSALGGAELGRLVATLKRFQIANGRSLTSGVGKPWEAALSRRVGFG